jgi:chorismate dehydratase
MNDFWKKEVAFLPSTSDEYIDEINGATAGLIIGDRALQNLGRFPFVYDLGEAWRMLTGMPFVFAVWVASKPMDRAFIEQFDAANSVGLQRLDELANAWPLPGVDMLSYYRDRISYRIDMQKRKALEGFLESIG